MPRFRSILLLVVLAGFITTAQAQDSLHVSLTGYHSLCWSSASDGVVLDTIACVAAGNSGVHLLDISDPTAPCEIGVCPEANTAVAVASTGSYVYVAAWMGGLKVVDVSDPARPALVQEIDLGIMVSDIAIEDRYAYVLDRWYGLYVFDLTKPSSPLEVGSCGIPGSDAFSLEVAGSRAYVVDGHTGLAVVDITAPNNPHLLNQVEVENTTWDVAVHEPYAYVASDEVYVFDVSDPVASIELVSTLHTNTYSTVVTVSGDHLYLDQESELLGIYDLVSPSHPSLVNTLEVGDRIDEVMISDERLYLCKPAGLDLYDLPDPETPGLLGGYSSPGTAAHLLKSGDLACAVLEEGWGADAQTEVRFLSARDLPISLLGSYPIAGSVTTWAATPTHLLFCNPEGTLHVLDISTPASPTVCGTLELMGNPVTMTTANGLLYVSMSAGDLRIIDISNPQEPTAVSILEAGHFQYPPDNLAAAGEMCIAADPGHLYVINAVNPQEPVVSGTTTCTHGGFTGLALSGEKVYATIEFDGSGGVCGFDISDPCAPAELGYCETPGGDCAHSLTVHDLDVYVADGCGGLQVVDFADPFAPFIAAYHGSYNHALRLISWGTTVAVVDACGLYRFKHRSPSGQMSTAWQFPVGMIPHSAQPNPFNRMTTLVFTLAQPRHVQWTIYNLLGQQVAQPANRPFDSGEQHVDFDGAGLSSGAYFYELIVGERRQVGKLLRIE